MTFSHRLQIGACGLALFASAVAGAAASERPPLHGADVAPRPDRIAAPSDVKVSSPDGKLVTVSWQWTPEPCGASSEHCAQVRESFFEVWADPRYPGAAGPRMLLRGANGGPSFSATLSTPAGVSGKQCYLVVAKAKYGKIVPLLGNAELPYDVRHLSEEACIYLGVKSAPYALPQATPAH